MSARGTLRYLAVSAIVSVLTSCTGSQPAYPSQDAAQRAMKNNAPSVPRERLREFLGEAGLTEYVDAILSEAAESIRLYPMAVDDEPALGRSKIGGHPDLPPGVDWPHADGKPLSLVAQINLSDVAPFDGHGQLPPKGMLYFFYDFDEQPWGYSPGDRMGWKVIYTDAPVASLKRTDAPRQDEFTLRPNATFQPWALKFVVEWTLPTYSSAYIRNLGMTWEESNEYYGVTEHLHSYSREVQGQQYQGGIHRLLGYPDPLQEADMQLQCQLVSNGVDTGGVRPVDERRVNELRPGYRQWQLLLQIDSEQEMMWGSSGIIYFWILQEDLQEKNFDKVWLVLQST